MVPLSTITTPVPTADCIAAFGSLPASLATSSSSSLSLLEATTRTTDGRIASAALA